jgi:hypothetical protein
MLLLEAVFAFFFSFALAYLFAAAFDRRGPWGTTWSMALVAFGIVLAAGLWIEPFGPPVYGLYFAPFIVTGLLVMLLFAAIPVGVATRRPTTKGSVTGDIALGMTFWIMIVALAAVSLVAITTETAGMI